MIEYEALEVAEDLSYEEKPLEILDRKVRTLRTRNIAFVKVWWRNQPMEEATLEREDDIKEKYPELFLARETFEDESPF